VEAIYSFTVSLIQRPSMHSSPATTEHGTTRSASSRTYSPPSR